MDNKPKIIKPLAIASVLCLILGFTLLFLTTHNRIRKETMGESIVVHWNDGTALDQSQQFTLITIDSCEYLIGDYDRGRMIAHKGNCRFCEERRACK